MVIPPGRPAGAPPRAPSPPRLHPIRRCLTVVEYYLLLYWQLILPDDDDHRPSSGSTRPSSLSFHCPTDGLIYHFPRPYYIDDDTGAVPVTEPCSGMYRGWLVMVAKDCPDSRYLLYNPISDIQLKVPHSPFPKDTQLIKPIVLLHGEDRQPFVVACFEGSKEIDEGAIMIWRPRNGLKQGWSRILHEWSSDFWYEDMIFYKGALYAVTNSRELRLIDFKDSDFVDPPQVRTEIPINFSISLSSAVMVEFKGELLLVYFLFPDSVIEVFKTNFVTREWEFIENLDDQVLLLTFELPLCMPTSSVTIGGDICDENSVYFTVARRRVVKYRLGDVRFRQSHDWPSHGLARSSSSLVPELPWACIQD